ncbi:MAG: hypothetical protein CVV58_05030, partial [Tenericutes bacterium HGW-Tenericutes-3]
MFADQLKNKHKRNIYRFLTVESILAIICIILFFAYEQYAKLSLLVLIGLVAFSMILFIFISNRRMKKAYELNYKITSLEYPVPFPSSFRKKQRTLLIDGRRGYTVNKKVIPAKFVEFVEGRRAYLIKELTEIHEINSYKILYIHEFTY